MKLIKRDYARVNPKPDAASVRQLDCWFEDYNDVHPKALGYRSPREFRQIVEKTTENAVGAMRRPREAAATEVIGSSSLAAHRGETRSVWLDASAAVDHPNSYSLSGYRAATSLNISHT